MIKQDDSKIKFRRSQELLEMYRCLAGLPSVLIRYVQSADSYEEMVKRSAEITEECEALMMRFAAQPCPAGQTWDEATGTCG